MYGIRNNIVVSVMLHTLMFAAAFIAGSISELRNTHMVAVSLVEEWGTKTTGQAKQNSSQQLLQKTDGKRVASINPAERKALPEIPRMKNETLPAAEPVIKQSLPSENNDSVSWSSSAQMTGSPAAGHRVSSPGSVADFITQGASTGSSDHSPATEGSRQQPGSVGDASLRRTIRAALQANLVYPYIARKRRMEGSVMVSFKINQTGNPEAISILKGSGYSILDSAARDTVVKASPFPATDSFVEVPITFSLKDH